MCNAQNNIKKKKNQTRKVLYLISKTCAPTSVDPIIFTFMQNFQAEKALHLRHLSRTQVICKIVGDTAKDGSYC